ncbi:hypothetical protein Fmac_008068 [Flemingia macrophylla]|uniref:EF-hand domain-containing protein n=1 Tax=Flemingia macrophylla TaxID=520843 RepID=A0ABD1MXJ1_9FABA
MTLPVPLFRHRPIRYNTLYLFFIRAQLKSIVAKESHWISPASSIPREPFKVIDKGSTGLVSVANLHHILSNIDEKLQPVRGQRRLQW